MVFICPRCKATNHCNSDSDYKCRKCSNTVKAISKVVAKVVVPKKVKSKSVITEIITDLSEPVIRTTLTEPVIEKDIKENDTREE